MPNDSENQLNTVENQPESQPGFQNFPWDDAVIDYVERDDDYNVYI